MLFSKTIFKPLVESFRLWIVTVLSTAIITGIALALTSNVGPEVFLALIIGGLVLGLPVLLVLLIMFTIIDNRPLSATEKSNRFVQAFSFLTLACTIPFLVLPILAGEAMATVFLVSAAVPVSASLSYLLQQKHIDNFFVFACSIYQRGLSISRWFPYRYKFYVLPLLCNYIYYKLLSRIKCFHTFFL